MVMAYRTQSISSLVRQLNIATLTNPPSTSSLCVSSSSRLARTTTARRSFTTSSLRRQEGEQTEASPPPASISTPAYPFSSQVRIHPSLPPSGVEGYTPLQRVRNPKRGVLPYVVLQLRSNLDPTARFHSLFSRQSPNQVPIGSVLSVEMWTSGDKRGTTTFSGVLMAVRRRGTSTSFVLRNLVLRLGVEMRFCIYSPLLKDIRIISKATGGNGYKQLGLKRVRRAKLYYLRERESQVAGVSRMIKTRKKQDDLAEQKEAATAAAAAREQSRANKKEKSKLKSK